MLRAGVGVGTGVCCRRFGFVTVEGGKKCDENVCGYISVILYELVSRTGNKPHPIQCLNNSIFFAWCAI